MKKERKKREEWQKKKEEWNRNEGRMKDEWWMIEGRIIGRNKRNERK